MKIPQSFRLILVLCFGTPLVSACSAATPAPTAVAVVPTATPVPPSATATLPTDTLTGPPTDTPTSIPPTAANTPTELPSATATLSPTLSHTATTTAVTATRIPPTAGPRPTSISTPVVPLVYSLEARPITPLTDALEKLLGRTGIALYVLNSYPGNLSFSFPGQESQTGVIGTNYQNIMIYNPAIGRQLFTSPLTISSNGMLGILWQPGTYAWSAAIPNVGQAQGNVTISTGQAFVLTFRP